MKFPFFHVDAFTDQPFAGNQAGVCILTKGLSTDIMQNIAHENNLAETAFVQKCNDKFSLRWFTPKSELPLCGHGTVATAHILWQEHIVDRKDDCVFLTASGDLTVKRLSENWIELDFPSFSVQTTSLPPDLIKVFPNAKSIYYTYDRYLIELNNENEVRNFIPDFKKLANHRFVITSQTNENSPYDFVSRYFAVPVGVDEDPVTGSAHCSLGPYWAKKLKKNEMIAYQASARGGVLKLKVTNGRVLISGKAITIFSGEYVLPGIQTEN